MASRWFREIAYDYLSTAASRSWWRKAYALWLQYVMEFTFQAESCGAGRSWVSTEKNGTGGAFAGGVYTFTDGTNPFVAGDLGKWIVLQDNTCPENGGVYKISAYNGVGSIDINFAAGYGEFPTVSTGIKWWIVSPSYQLPTTGEYVRFQSRHATSWAVELTAYETYGSELRVRVAPTGSWTGPIIGLPYNAGLEDTDCVGFTAAAPNGSGRFTYFAEGDYDTCEWIHFWAQLCDKGGGGDSNAVLMVSINRVTPIEAGIPDADLIVLRGPRLSSASVQYDMGNRWYEGPTSSYPYNRGLSWHSARNAEVTGHCVDYSYEGYSVSYGSSPREINRRRSDFLLDAMVGQPYMCDTQNANGGYGFLGYLKGQWLLPFLPTSYQTTGNLTTHNHADRAVHKLAPISMGADRNRLLVSDGITVAWCGLSVVGQGIVP